MPEQSRLGLVHDNQALRRANENMAREIRVLRAEPGRETLEQVDTLLRRAGLVDRLTVEAVRDLIQQRDEARKNDITRQQFEEYVALDMVRTLGEVWRLLPQYMKWDAHTGYWRQFTEAGIVVKDVTERTYQALASAAPLSAEE